jgi:hypothetical protein
MIGQRNANGIILTVTVSPWCLAIFAQMAGGDGRNLLII